MNTSPAATSPRPSPTIDPEVATSTLAGEHALLLRDVRRRADSVLALLLETRSWPHAELGSLTRYLRTSVARQATEEEALLYPNGASAPFAELTTEHVQLHNLTERLDQADAASCSGVELCEMIEQLLRMLEDHLVQEQAVLAALPEAPDPVPAVADLAAASRAWPARDPLLTVPTTDDRAFISFGGMT